MKRFVILQNVLCVVIQSIVELEGESMNEPEYSESFWEEYDQLKKERDKFKKDLELIAETLWRCDKCGFPNRNDYAKGALKNDK